MRAAVAHDLPRLRFEAGRIRRGALTDLRHRFVLPTRGVDKRDIRPVGAVPRIGSGVDDSLRVADGVVVDERAERATELPACVLCARERWPAAAREAERDQLIFRAEVLLREPTDPLRRVIHGPRTFGR